MKRKNLVQLGFLLSILTILSASAQTSEPIKYLSIPKAIYPVESKLAGEEGKVTVKVKVDTTGQAISAVVVTSSGFPHLDQAAIEAMLHARYKPYIENGEPIVVSVTGTINFALHRPQARFPEHGIPAFLAQTLDLQSFPNSLRPQIDNTRPATTFADLKLSPSKLSEDTVEFDSDDWFYALQIRHPITDPRNADDIDVCFIDKSYVGSYFTITPLRLSYSSGWVTGQVTDSFDGCEASAN